jgi:hypothetical protein
MREGKFTILILVILALLGAVWTAYSSATTISELPPLVDPPIGIFIGLIVFFISVFSLLFKLLRDKYIIEKALPLLGFVKADTKILDIVVLKSGDMTTNSTSGEWEIHYRAAQRGGQPPKPYEFAFIEIKNKPKHKSEKGWARGVYAKVECIDRQGNKKIEYYARPADTPAPWEGSFDYGQRESIMVDIEPGGLPRGFNIAFIAPGESSAYGFSNKSYKYYGTTTKGGRYYDWRNPELEMPEDEYMVRVTLAGDNIDTSELLCDLKIRQGKMVIECNEELNMSPQQRQKKDKKKRKFSREEFILLHKKVSESKVQDSKSPYGEGESETSD